MSDTRTPVLYLAPWVDYGGSDKGTIDWFKWIDRSRFAPYLVTTQPSDNHRLADVLPYAEEVWALPELLPGSRFPEFILDFIHSRDVRIVHIMNSRLGFDLLPDLRSLEDRPRIVVQLHVEEHTKDGYVRYVTTRYGNLVDAFSVTSHQLAQVVEAYGVSPDRIEVISTGVDADDEFSPDRVVPRAGLSPGTTHILYPGRLVEQKDPLLMVEVAREMRDRGLSFKLHVVGAGELESEVRDRVRRHDLEQIVGFEPPTNELAPWYAASDILLMTSVYEGVPYVVYEALAMGLAVVAPALPGNVELMGDVGGTLVSERDAAAFADALEPLVSDRELRGRVGAAGRELMLTRHTLRAMGDRHGELYDRLLNGTEPEPQPEPLPALPQLTFPGRPSRGTPLVSVLTPCFNHGEWLRECIESVRAQTYPAVEMIVIDDASSQADTHAYLSELEGAADVEVLRMERNSGPSAARNRGLELARGRYVLPLDSDNLLLPDAIERLVNQLQGAGERVGFVYPTIQYFGNRELYFEPPAYNAWLLTKGNYIDTCALIDRSVFDAGIRYPEEIVLGHEDWDFFLTLFEHGVHGVAANGKTLRYRKHGFTRSDLVDWTVGTFQESIPSRHPRLFATGARQRGDNAYVRMKSQWAPALSIVALKPVALHSEEWLTVSTRLAAQRLRDFELLTVVDGQPGVGERLPPIRTVPELGSPGETLAHALEQVASPNVLVTYGAGAEFLDDPGSLERVARLLEHGDSSGIIGFSDAGAGGRFPWRLLAGDDPALELHSIAWTRRHKPIRETPGTLDSEDPIGALARWQQIRRISVDWRHMPLVTPAPRRRAGSPVPRPAIPASRAERSERESRESAEICLPGAPELPLRVRLMSAWAPAFSSPLTRFRRHEADEWRFSTQYQPPDYFYVERTLGLVYWMSFEGTSRIVEDPEHGWALVPRGSEPNADDMERTLGYADQVAFPLLEPLMLCRHAATAAHVLLCGADDPLRPEVEWPELAVLGWLDRVPIGPQTAPRTGESTAWLRGLVRTIDRGARRHRVQLGGPVGGEAPWELGAVLDRDPGGGIPVWVDVAGRLHAGSHDPATQQFDPTRAVKWAAAPVAWRGIAGAAPRLRAVARRSVDAIGVGLRSRHPAAASTPSEPQGWLLAHDGPHRVPIYSAVHSATLDQLVTRDPSEARELGYGPVELLGYALAVTAATDSLARPLMSIPWGSRFGTVLSQSEDPLVEKGR